MVTMASVLEHQSSKQSLKQLTLTLILQQCNSACTSHCSTPTCLTFNNYTYMRTLIGPLHMANVHSMSSLTFSRVTKHAQTLNYTIYTNADFARNWNRIELADPDTAQSSNAYIIMFTCCPIYWQSMLPTVIALSSTKAEVISLTQALHTMIPLMDYVREMKHLGHNIPATSPVLRCHLIEDNSAAIKLATYDKVQPRMKYMGTKWHHFQDYIK